MRQFVTVFGNERDTKRYDTVDKLGLAIHRGFLYSQDTFEFSEKNPFRYINQVDQTLKHYTQPGTVSLILNTERIRLSKISEMRNDATEGKYV